MVLSHGRFLAFAILFLPISFAIDGFLSYYDEVFVLFYLLFGLFGRYRYFSKKNKRTLVFIGIYYLLGFISNYYSHIISSVFPVFIDSFTVYKQFLIFEIIINIANKKDKLKVISTLLPIAKFYVVLAGIIGLVSQFIDLGMTASERYGIKGFSFVSNNHSGFGITIIACLLIFASSSINKSKFLLYSIISLISLLLTTKGVIYSFITFGIVIYVVSKRGSLKTRDFVILIISLLLVSSFQIKTYFMDNNSARMVLLVSSFNIANSYYPLGSGFATFGGQQAKINYSPLYYKYGLNNVYGLSEKNGDFLNDDYIAMILAQTGYFGLLLYFIIIYRIFQIINKNDNISVRLKIVSLAILLMLYVSSVATGIIKTPNGVFLFALIAVLQTNNQLILKKRINA